MRWQTLLHFISLCSAVICCNPDWFPYGQKCYRGIQFDYDIRMARRYCQTFRGDLAVINDNSTLQNIAPILFENSNEISYWVHENSTLGGSSTSSYCSYIYTDETLSVKLGSDGNCDNGKQFVCEVPKTDSEYTCPTSWSYYGNICYKTFKNSATYNQAVSFCSLQRAQLAVLDDIAKEHNAAAVIIGQKDAYLVAAKQDRTNQDESIKWTSGSIFQPSCPECVAKNDSKGECIGFHSDQQHPTLFTWVTLNCSASNYYMCEMQPILRSTTVTSTEPTTTLAPLQCPVGYNWKAHEESGFCYWETTYESERLNWYEARKFCQAYGGDLATYDNANQEEHGLGGARGHYRGLWFGLKRGKDDILRWVDNVTRSYSNWYGNEPNYGSPSKFCAKHGERSSQWELDYCGVKRWFVCKAPKTRDPTMPNLEDISKKIPCNFSGPSVYRTQWYLFDNHCYLVRDEAKYSWDTAQYFCQDNGGHLASIHSFEETDFILRLLSNTPNTDFWIGLSARGLDSSLTWSDGTPFEFLYWEDRFNYTSGINKCVTFDKQIGSWRTEHCNRFLGAVCKRGVNASYDFTTPEPTPLMPGNCEKGWYRLGNKCYKSFGGRWSKRETWDDAKKECEKQEATLASIHSVDDQNFLTDIMLDLGKSMWIGLENIDKGTVFKWSDDSPLDFTEWNANEPSLTADDNEYGGRPSRLCVELVYDSNNMGKWSDVSCYHSTGYVCQKFINPLLTEPSEDPFLCRNISGWSRLGSTCFGVFEDSQLSWIEAQAKCRTFDADLVTFSSSADAIFLKKKIKKLDQFFWIGTRETRNHAYESVRKHKESYSNWLAGQPDRRSDIGNCVAMNSQTKWMIRDCKEKLSFVCAWSSEDRLYAACIESAIQIPSRDQWLQPRALTRMENRTFCTQDGFNATLSVRNRVGECWEEEEEIKPVLDYNPHPCPGPLWVRLGLSCYYFSYKDATWTEAMLLCYKNGGALASFHSLGEVQLVKNHISRRLSSQPSFSIGLGQLADGSYAWVDHSPLDYTNWEYGYPPAKEINRECVKFWSFSGKWSATDCDDMKRPYICSLSKSGVKRFELHNLTKILNEVEASKSERTADVVTASIGTGGIIGILISVLLVLIVIGAVIYHLYPFKTMRPTLLEHDDL